MESREPLRTGSALRRGTGSVVKQPQGTGDGSRSEKSSDEIRELAVDQPTAGKGLIIPRRT